MSHFNHQLSLTHCPEEPTAHSWLSAFLPHVNQPDEWSELTAFTPTTPYCGVAPNKWQPFSINSGIPICSFRILVNIESDTDISNQPAISVQNPSSGHILHHVFLNTAPIEASNAHGIPSPGTSLGRWNKSWLLCFRTTKCSCIRWPALQL